VAVLRKLGAQPIARFARTGAADGVRQDNEILRGVERLTGGEQLVGKRREKPSLTARAGAVQQQDRVGDVARSIALGRAECRVMQLQLAELLAVREGEVLDDEVALALVWPAGLSERLRGQARRGEQHDGGEASANGHGGPPVAARKFFVTVRNHHHMSTAAAPYPDRA